MFRRLTTIAVVAAAILSPLSATANSAPNPFTPISEAWVNVPANQRVYLHDTGSGFDDDTFIYLPAGVSCTQPAGVTGPVMLSSGATISGCVDETNTPYTPVTDASSRQNAVPFGFNINFYGTTVNSAWPNSNGQINLAGHAWRATLTLPDLANRVSQPMMFALPYDLVTAPGQSNFWTAQTVVGGRQAVVFAWEKYHVYGGDLSDHLSVQLVLVNRENGDFDMHVNIDNLSGFGLGQVVRGPWFLTDLNEPDQAGSNVFPSTDAALLPDGCVPVYASIYGTMSSTNFFPQGQTFYVSRADGNHLSLWSDASCTLTKALPTAQDVAGIGRAWVEFMGTTTDGTYVTLPMGWAGRDEVTNAPLFAEVGRNLNVTALFDASRPDQYPSENTDVPGRFIIGQRNGEVVTDPALFLPEPTVPSESPSPTPPTPSEPGDTAALASTGVSESTTAVALGALFAVAAGAAVRRRATRP